MKKTLCLILSAVLLMFPGCAPGNQEPEETTQPVTEEPWDMSEPPRLTVTCGDVSFVLNYAGCSWEGPALDGQSFAKIACGASPLDDRTPPRQFSVGAEELVLSFDVEPASLVINMWDDPYTGKDGSPEETLLDTFRFQPLSTARIYEVIATWEGDYHGEARYHFRLIPGVMPIG